MRILLDGPRPERRGTWSPESASSTRAAVVVGTWVVFLAIAALGCRGPSATAVRVAADAWPDPYREPTATLMWPGTTRAVRILPTGALRGGAWTLTLAPAADGRPAAPPRRVAFEDRWLPVAYWARRAGDLRWEFEAVPAPWPRSRTETLRDTMRPSGDEPRVEPDEAASGDPRSAIDSLLLRAGRRVTVADADARPLAVSLRVRVTNVGAQPRRATLRAELDGAAGEDGGVAAARPRDVRAFRAGVTLSPGESREVRWGLVTHPVPAARVRAWLATPHERQAAECRAFWTREVARGAAFDLGDADLDRAIRAARVTLLSLRERRDGAWMALGGPIEGRDAGPGESARTMRALAFHGYVGEARELAAGLLAGQWPQGAFAGAGDPRAATGQTLWAFEQVLLRPSPARNLRRYAEAADRAWRWSDRVRRAPAPGSNGDDRSAAPASVELWALAGDRAAARLLDAAGMRSRATEALAARERARRAFEAGSARRRARGGGSDAEERNELELATACATLPADHPRVRRLVRRYGRARRDDVPYDAVAAPVEMAPAAALAAQALRAGRAGRADSVLAGLVRWTNASGGASAAFDPRTGEAGTPPPQAAPAAALLTLVREALIDDDGDRLELTLGVRRAWWIRGGSLRRAPTRWGELTLRFDWRGDVARWSWTPVPVWTALTLPPHSRLAAPPPAPLLGEIGGTRVMVPPGVGDARVRVRDVTPAPRAKRRPVARPPVPEEDADTIGAAAAPDTAAIDAPEPPEPEVGEPQTLEPAEPRPPEPNVPELGRR